MPSGAKKRKAAKKKLQKDANFYGSNSNSIGNDNAKSHDERESDVGEGERESSEESVVNNNAEVNEEVSLGERNIAEFSKEEKSEGSYDDVSVNVDEDEIGESKNGELKRSSSSSSSSSSSDDEVAVEKERVLVEEVVQVEQQVLGSLPDVSSENPGFSEVVYNSVEETIPVEESVKQVVSLPHESNAENEGEAVSSVTSHEVESEMKQTSDVPSVNEEDTVSPGMTAFVEKSEEKLIQLVDEGSEKLSGFVDMAARHGESLLSQSSGVTSADAASGNNHVKESETHKYIEEQPFISSAPLPVRRTSWTNCCGLFEVFSGGANR